MIEPGKILQNWNIADSAAAAADSVAKWARAIVTSLQFALTHGESISDKIRAFFGLLLLQLQYGDLGGPAGGISKIIGSLLLLEERVRKTVGNVILGFNQLKAQITPVVDFIKTLIDSFSSGFSTGLQDLSAAAGTAGGAGGFEFDASGTMDRFKATAEAVGRLIPPILAVMAAMAPLATKIIEAFSDMVGKVSKSCRRYSEQQGGLRDSRLRPWYRNRYAGRLHSG